MGHLGLEGMTNEDIRQMHEENSIEEEHYRDSLARSLRWLERDKPHMMWRWWIARVFLGIVYEDVFHSGWFFGMGEGRRQRGKK